MPKGVYPRRTTVARFLSKVEKTNTCWLWTAYRLKDGYGGFNFRGKTTPAHRYAYRAFIGAIPVGMLVRHTCDVPACVNPKHLVLGTQKDNCRDAVVRGRNVKGEKHGMSKITSRQAKLVKRMLRRSMAMTDIARRTGIGYYTVYDIKRGRAWGHA